MQHSPGQEKPYDYEPSRGKKLLFEGIPLHGKLLEGQKLAGTLGAKSVREN
jgi:hypothetical protein